MRRALSASLVAAFIAAPALAKLPAPSDEAKAKAAETAAKTAWTDKVAAFKLCLVQDRTAEHYRKTAPALGKTVSPAVATPPCADPGAYVPPPAASTPPLEASGAHSPPHTVTAPPSSQATAAEQQGKVKK